MSSERSVVKSGDAPEAIGPYSQAIRHGELLICSGQVPLDPGSGEIVGQTPAEQAVQCLKNLAAVCEAGGPASIAPCGSPSTRPTSASSRRSTRPTRPSSATLRRRAPLSRYRRFRRGRLWR